MKAAGEDPSRPTLVAVMRKIAGSDPAHGDWRFAEYTRGAPGERFGAPLTGAVCWSCHAIASDTDWVFTAPGGERPLADHLGVARRPAGADERRRHEREDDDGQEARADQGGAGGLADHAELHADHRRGDDERQGRRLQQAGRGGCGGSPISPR